MKGSTPFGWKKTRVQREAADRNCEAMCEMLDEISELNRKLLSGENVRVSLMAQLLELTSAVVSQPEEDLATRVPYMLPITRTKLLFTMGTSSVHSDELRTVSLRLFLLFFCFADTMTESQFLMSTGVSDAILSGLSDQSDSRAAVMYALALRAFNYGDTSIIFRSPKAVAALDVARPSQLTLQMHLKLKGFVQL